MLESSHVTLQLKNIEHAIGERLSKWKVDRFDAAYQLPSGNVVHNMSELTLSLLSCKILYKSVQVCTKVP